MAKLNTTPYEVHGHVPARYTVEEAWHAARKLREQQQPVGAEYAALLAEFQGHMNWRLQYVNYPVLRFFAVNQAEAVRMLVGGFVGSELVRKNFTPANYVWLQYRLARDITFGERAPIVKYFSYEAWAAACEARGLCVYNEGEDMWWAYKGTRPGTKNEIGMFVVGGEDGSTVGMLAETPKVWGEFTSCEDNLFGNNPEDFCS